MSYTKRIPTDPNAIKKKILEAKDCGMLIEEHTKKRMLERGITHQEIEVILEYGTVIEEQEHIAPPKIRYVVYGSSKLPIGIIVAISKGGRLIIKTVLKM